MNVHWGPTIAMLMPTALTQLRDGNVIAKKASVELARNATVSNRTKNTPYPTTTFPVNNVDRVQ